MTEFRYPNFRKLGRWADWGLGVVFSVVKWGAILLFIAIVAALIADNAGML